jgi:tellurite resistance protein TehA-like permease
MEAGLTLIISRTGEANSRKLMKFNSGFIPKMPTIFTSLSWLNGRLQWLSSQQLVNVAIACSSGRAYTSSIALKSLEVPKITSQANDGNVLSVYSLADETCKVSA